MLLRRLAVEITRNEELNGRYYAVTLPEDHEIATVGEFWLGCRQTAAQEDDASPQKAAELHRIPAADDDTLEDYAIGALSDFSDRIDRHLVLLVDNIDQLFAALANADAGWRIRHVLQTDQRFALVGAASNRFDEIDRAERALYQGLSERRLRPLTADQCETLWSRISGYPAGRPVMRTTIEMIAAVTRGNAPVGEDLLGRVEADDHHVDVGHAAGVRTPGERAVGEGDLQAAPEQQRPELRRLLALRDRVGGHEPDPRPARPGAGGARRTYSAARTNHAAT